MLGIKGLLLKEASLTRDARRISLPESLRVRQLQRSPLLKIHNPGEISCLHLGSYPEEVCSAPFLDSLRTQRSLGRL